MRTGRFYRFQLGIRAAFLGVVLAAAMAVTAHVQASEIEPPMSETQISQLPFVPKHLYQPPSIPSRLEPDKSCGFYDGKSKLRIQGIKPSGYIWAFDRERTQTKMKLAAQKRAVEKGAVKKNTDPCPLISIPTPAPHNPMQRHIPARSP